MCIRDSFNTYQEVIELQVQGVPEVTTRRMVPYGERVAITNGMVIQFENMVAKIPSKLQEAQLRLAQCQDTIVQCDRLIGRPFPQAVELAAAQDRFQQTSGLLQAMDGQAELQDPSAEQAIARARTLTQQANATGTGADARDKLRRMADELRAQGEPPEADREPPTRHDPTRPGDSTGIRADAAQTEGKRTTTPTDPPRLRPRLPEPHQLHRQKPARDRMLKTTPTPPVVKLSLIHI